MARIRLVSPFAWATRRSAAQNGYFAASIEARQWGRRLSVSKRLGLMIGVVAAGAILAYLCLPGHGFGAFFYNLAPPIFRESVIYLQQSNGFGEGNGPAYWSEVEKHVLLTLESVGVATAICFPMGVIGSRIRIARIVATNIVGIARGIPGIAVLFVMWQWLGATETNAVVAMTLLAAPPIFLNTVAGYAGVAPSTVEAARGMGMDRFQVLARIETPLAASVIIAGIRTATVEVVASATIVAFINVNTLGVQIFDGVGDPSSTTGQAELAVGIFGVAVLAWLAELLLTQFQRLATPRYA